MTDLVQNEDKSLDTDEYHPSDGNPSHPQEIAMYDPVDEFPDPSMMGKDPVDDDPLEPVDDVIDHHRAQYSKSSPHISSDTYEPTFFFGV